MLLSVKPRIYNTHTQEKDPVKGILLAYSIKKGSGQCEIDHISLKGKDEKLHSPPMSKILSDALT